MPIYEATTANIQVSVEPNFLPDQSEPEQHRYVWSYRVVIKNTGALTVQLRSRYWRITDATGRVQEVRGEGVVGEQPVLSPGESYAYTSGCPLPTSSGFMGGAYHMQTREGNTFDVEIPTFSLDSPYHKAVVH